MKKYIRRAGIAWPAVLVLAALIAFGVYFFFRSMAQMRAMEREAAAPPPTEASAYAEAGAPAQAAPDAAFGIRLRDLDGREVSMAQFKGKPVFVTFWATWCRFCLMELPSIQKLHDSLAGEEVVFLMVSSEGPAQVKPFLEKNDYSFPVFLQEGALPSVYRTEGIPATFILDKEGKIARRQVGAMDWDNDEVRKLLKDLARS